jgi:hypothetical protein
VVTKVNETMRRVTLIFACTSVVTGVGIAYIHEQQKIERENLHQGVIRDKELYRKKLQELKS